MLRWEMAKRGEGEEGYILYTCRVGCVIVCVLLLVVVCVSLHVCTFWFVAAVGLGAVNTARSLDQEGVSKEADAALLLVRFMGWCWVFSPS